MLVIVARAPTRRLDTLIRKKLQTRILYARARDLLMLVIVARDPKSARHPDP